MNQALRVWWTGALAFELFNFDCIDVSFPDMVSGEPVSGSDRTVRH